MSILDFAHSCFWCGILASSTAHEATTESRCLAPPVSFIPPSSVRPAWQLSLSSFRPSLSSSATTVWVQVEFFVLIALIHFLFIFQMFKQLETKIRGKYRIRYSSFNLHSYCKYIARLDIIEPGSDSNLTLSRSKLKTLAVEQPSFTHLRRYGNKSLHIYPQKFVILKHPFALKFTKQKEKNKKLTEISSEWSFARGFTMKFTNTKAGDRLVSHSQLTMLLSQCKSSIQEFEFEYVHCQHLLAIQLFQTKYLGWN